MSAASLNSSSLIEIEDPEEETFLLFSESIPSQNLGFVDSKATILDLTVNGRDLSIHQSPTILSSTRDGGTTGAVVWKITPLISTWLLSPLSPFLLTTTTTILELGCGISGITALSIAPKIGKYVLTDQQYIMKYLHQNLLENQSTSSTSSSRSNRKGATKSKSQSTERDTNIITFTLDWETSDIPSTLTASNITNLDIVLACDCIYNSHLIKPLVSTCSNLCKFNSTTSNPTKSSSNSESEKQTICIIAQQLRSPEIFEEWLQAFMQEFKVWRVADEALVEGLKASDGFVVHVGVLRDS